MRPPFDAQEPNRDPSLVYTLGPEDVARLLGGNPLLVDAVLWGGTGSDVDAISYDPSTGWRWQRLPPDQQRDWWFANKYSPRDSGAFPRQKNYAYQEVSHDLPSPAALALATSADWDEVVRIVQPAFIVDGDHLWLLRQTNPRIAGEVMQKICERENAWMLARGVARGNLNQGDVLSYTKPGKRRECKQHLKAWFSMAQPGVAHPSPPPTPSVSQSGQKPRKPPPDPFAGLTKDEVARMDPGT